MFKYRDHKGSFIDSMNTVQSFNTKQDLIDYLHRSISFPISIFDLYTKLSI